MTVVSPRALDEIAGIGLPFEECGNSALQDPNAGVTGGLILRFTDSLRSGTVCRWLIFCIYVLLQAIRSVMSSVKPFVFNILKVCGWAPNDARVGV